MTLDVIAKRVGSSRTRMSDLERGKSAPTSRMLDALDKEFGSARLSRLWDELTGDGREAWRYELAELIDTAWAVYEYQVLVFPAHLQTVEYSRTLFRNGTPWLTPDEAEHRAAQRWERAQRVAERHSPKLWLVVDETIFGRRYGGVGVMRRQLEHVADLVQTGRLSVQVISSDAPGHPGVSGPFKLITRQDEPEVMFAESVREGQVVVSQTEVAQYRMLYAALQAAADSPERSLERIRREIEGLNHAA